MTDRDKDLPVTSLGVENDTWFVETGNSFYVTGDQAKIAILNFYKLFLGDKEFSRIADTVLDATATVSNRWYIVLNEDGIGELVLLPVGAQQVEGIEPLTGFHISTKPYRNAKVTIGVE